MPTQDLVAVLARQLSMSIDQAGYLLERFATENPDYKSTLAELVYGGRLVPHYLACDSRDNFLVLKPTHQQWRYKDGQLQINEMTLPCFFEYQQNCGGESQSISIGTIRFLSEFGLIVENTRHGDVWIKGQLLLGKLDNAYFEPVQAMSKNELTECTLRLILPVVSSTICGPGLYLNLATDPSWGGATWSSS